MDTFYVRIIIEEKTFVNTTYSVCPAGHAPYTNR